MLQELMEFHASVYDGLNLGNFVERLPEWICTNTAVKNKAWSFDAHEFQLGILKEDKPEMGCQKCSQVGLTELEVRRILAFSAMNVGVTGIYTLPTRNFAMKFAKSRVDTVIDRSPTLLKLLKSGANGSEFKQVGTSSLYFGGAQNASQAISIPADYLCQDEIDFCNAAALSAYESRIRHSDMKIRRMFSTPTVSGYGINQYMDTSTKGRYTVKCSKCNTESALDFFKDVVIPGFDNDFDKFEKGDLSDPRIKVDEAYLACPSCRNPIDRDLADASRRRWVHAHPSRTAAGYYVKPFDLIKYNPVSSLITQIKGYIRKQDYINFVHGETYKSDETEINLGTVNNNTTEREQDSGEGCYMGVDVGKRLNIFIGKPINGKLVILKAMTLMSSDSTAEDLEYIFNQYKCYRMVIDSAPEWSLCKQLLGALGEFVHPCVYVNENPKKPEAFTVKDGPDDHNMLNAARTTTIDCVVADVNKGKVLFPQTDEMLTVKKHFQGMKKTEEFDETGQKVSKWTKISDEDHYFHALIYCWLACKVDNPEIYEASTVSPTNILGAMTAMRDSGVGLETGVGIREALSLVGINIGKR